MKSSIRAALLAACLTLGAMPTAAQTIHAVPGVPLEMEPNTCDRACLEGKLEAYLRANSSSDTVPSLIACR